MGFCSAGSTPTVNSEPEPAAGYYSLRRIRASISLLGSVRCAAHYTLFFFFFSNCENTSNQHQQPKFVLHRERCFGRSPPADRLTGYPAGRCARIPQAHCPLRPRSGVIPSPVSPPYLKSGRLTSFRHSSCRRDHLSVHQMPRPTAM